MSKSKNMRKRRGKGAGLIILIFSIIAFIVYAYFLLGTDWGIVVLRLTGTRSSYCLVGSISMDRLHNGYGSGTRRTMTLYISSSKTNVRYYLIYSWPYLSNYSRRDNSMLVFNKRLFGIV